MYAFKNKIIIYLACTGGLDAGLKHNGFILGFPVPQWTWFTVRNMV